MQENNFEKDVQKKMAYLQLGPTNEVWKKVQEAIAKKRKRKIGWLVFLLLFVCLSAGSYIWIFQPSKTKLANNESNINLVKVNDTSFTSKTIRNSKPLKKNISSNINITPETRLLKTQNKLVARPVESTVIVTAKYFATRQTPANTSKDFSNNKNTAAIYKQQKNAHTSKAKTFMQVVDATIETTNDIDLPNMLPRAYASFSLLEFASSKHQPLTTNLPVVTASKSLLLAEKFGDQKLKTKEINVATKNRQHQKLLFLISFGVGRAATASNYLGTTANSTYYDNALFQNTSSGAGQDPNNRFSSIPSELNPGYGIYAGVSVVKKISQKTNLSIGLQYQLLNTNNKVGQVIVRADGSKAFETGNNNYQNKYHFIQIPVEFTAQLTNGKQHNIYLHTGLSISQLLHTNALQFNTVARQYFISNDYFNKTTIGFSAGISINLLKRNDAPLLLGPVMYYSLTPIAGKGLYDNSRYGFLGLRLQKLINSK